METCVQDFVSACLSLSREAFAAALGGPLLVVIKSGSSSAFRQAATEMASGRSKKKSGRPQLSHQQAVIELRRADGRPFDSINIGRSEECDVVIDDETVSGRHARMFYVRTTREVLIEDLHSTNGTLVNGKPLIPERAQRLVDGDEIGLGDSRYIYYSPEGFYDALRWLLAES